MPVTPVMLLAEGKSMLSVAGGLNLGLAVYDSHSEREVWVVCCCCSFDFVPGKGVAGHYLLLLLLLLS